MIQKKLRARCGKCETIWVVTDLPKPVEEVAELMISASCPRCGENKEVYLANDKVSPMTDINAAVPGVLDDASLQAQISEVGNQIHNLSCEYQNNEPLSERLQDLRGKLWDISKRTAKPVDFASWAQDLLAAWDQQYSCRQRDDVAKALSEKLILAACFAGIAYDAAMSLPIMEDKAPEFLLRIFLIALIDQNSPELDPYRAKNNPQAVTHTDDAKPVDVNAVREQAFDKSEYVLDAVVLALDALLAARKRFVAIDPDWDQWHIFPKAIEALNATPNIIRALSAEPAQGQLPQDVINLVIAGRELVYSGEVAVGSHEAKALDKALEAFASRIPWENEPDELTSPTTEAGK